MSNRSEFLLSSHTSSEKLVFTSLDPIVRLLLASIQHIDDEIRTAITENNNQKISSPLTDDTRQKMLTLLRTQVQLIRKLRQQIVILATTNKAAFEVDNNLEQHRRYALCTMAEYVILPLILLLQSSTKFYQKSYPQLTATAGISDIAHVNEYQLIIL